jgi:hypothetical protein
LSLEILSCPRIFHVLSTFSDVILSHSCSTFILYASPPRREHCKWGLPSFLGRRYEGAPEYDSFSKHFYGAIPFEYWHGNFPSVAKTTVTPGRHKGASSALLSHTALTGRVPPDLRSQTSQIARGPRDFPLDSTAHHSDTRGIPSLLTDCDSFGQSTSHSFAADVSPSHY